MANLHPRSLKELSSRRLRQTDSNPRQLVFIYTGVFVALNLAVNGLNLLLSQQIGSTGGLSGLGTRSILETIQTLLSYFSTFFTPFWQAGFLYSMVCIARGLSAPTAGLTRGFRRFGSIIGYVFWQMLILMVLSMALSYPVVFLFLITPFGQEFTELLLPLMENSEFILADGSINMAVAPVDALFTAMIPMLIMYAAILIPLYIHIAYRLRMTEFLLVEGPARGALGAMLVSNKMMKGHKWQMLKLDLSFWWYYLAEAALLLILYLDVILPLLGVSLPVDSTVAYFITLVLYGLLELGLHLWKKAEVDVTYCCAYECIYRDFFQGNPPESGYGI